PLPDANATGSVTVTANVPDAPWTVVNNSPWIAITSGLGGTGNGTVTLTAADNHLVRRNATVTIAGVDVVVSQAGGSNITPYAASGSPWDLVAGPDGATWFTERQSGKIGRITTAGAITEFTIPIPNSSPSGITVGPDGALWFTASGSGTTPPFAFIGRITTA